jgi:hypothetical protein
MRRTPEYNTMKATLKPTRNNGTSAATNGSPAPDETSRVVTKEVQVNAPNMVRAQFTIRGTTPLVIQRFSTKSQEAIMGRQREGTTSKTKKGSRAPKDFDQLWKDALYVSNEGWNGFNATAIRCGIISVCRLVDYKMTLAKMSIWCIADGYDMFDNTPLVRITKGEPEQHLGPGRLATGVFDIKSRPLWKPGWEAVVTLGWDQDQFTHNDVTNLLWRMGLQNGLGEGRMNSRQSNGCGWGSFEVLLPNGQRF